MLVSGIEHNDSVYIYISLSMIILGSSMLLKITLFHFLLVESCSIMFMDLFFFIHLSPHKQYVYFHFGAIAKCRPVNVWLHTGFKTLSSQLFLGVILQNLISLSVLVTQLCLTLCDPTYGL